MPTTTDPMKRETRLRERWGCCTSFESWHHEPAPGRH
jgi:hypothetical protein